MLRTIFKIVKKLSKQKASNKKSLPWRAFFYIFWKLEERSERINLDIKSTLPIQGSERAVLIETILASDFSSLLDVGTAYGQNLLLPLLYFCTWITKLVLPRLKKWLEFVLKELLF
jgi:hypothetical protein